jgi:hypothetical protein
MWWAFCPKCKGVMGQLEAVCPHCGYNFPPDPPPPDYDVLSRQFGIRFLFYLMGLTSFVGSTCSCLGRHSWILAPALFITGLLVWHARKFPYAVLPGLAIGFAIGLALNLAVDPKDKIATGVWIATIGCPLNAMFNGFPKSGFLALLGGIASSIATAIAISD